MDEQDRKRQIASRVEERRRWAEFHRRYERCVAIAEAIWEDRPDAAQLVQQRLAEDMRDRRREGILPMEIPVPLFTPRDREQFIKEVATHLNIEANRQNLSALPELKDAETKPEAGAETAPEAAAGVDEVSPVAERTA